MLKGGKASDLIEELDLGGHLAEASDAAARRYILKDGQLEALPTGPLSFLSTGILSTLGKLRLAFEPLRAASTKGSESVASFIRRRLGSEALDYLVDPFLAGVWAGDASELSIEHVFSSLKEFENQYGSIAFGGLAELSTRLWAAESPGRRLVNFESGMESLVRRLAARCEAQIAKDKKVQQLELMGDNCFRLQLQASGGSSKTARFDAVVSTVPAFEFASMLTESELVERISSLKYSPVAVVNQIYRRRDIEHPVDGFGFLVPSAEKRDLLGCLFPSTIFPGRAPPTQCILTSFVGGGRAPELASLGDHSVETLVTEELDDILGLNGAATESFVKKWERAIPQYGLDYQETLEAIERVEQRYPGLLIGGAAVGGPGLPDRIAAGYQLAERTDAILGQS
jgi:oxygen-dependent protoporphyrinogen oxidase